MNTLIPFVLYVVWPKSCLGTISSMILSGHTTLVTMPQAAASPAVMGLPVSSISLAAPLVDMAGPKETEAKPSGI